MPLASAAEGGCLRYWQHCGNIAGVAGSSGVPLSFLCQRSLWRGGKLSFRRNCRLERWPNPHKSTEKLQTSSVVLRTYTCVTGYELLPACNTFLAPQPPSREKWRRQTAVGVVPKRGGRIQKHVPMQVDPPEVEKGRFAFNVESAINQLSALVPRASIARCMDSFKNQLSPQDFALIFREFAQRGDWQRALRLFKYMQRQAWCNPSEHVYTIMIGIMGREGMLDRASEIFEDMPRNNVEWSVYSFTALINAYGRNGQHDHSLELLARMKDCGIQPNVITYNTVINACGKGGLEWPVLMELFAEMKEDGVTPDIITYNTLLSTCNARGLVPEAGEVFSGMVVAGVRPDEVTYASLVETYGRLGQYRGAEDLVGQMEEMGEAPDTVAYNVLIDAYGQAGLYEEAGRVFLRMQAAGREPNVVTYSTLLDAYGRHGVFGQVRTLFAEMKDKGTAPNVITYNTLIDIFGKGGHFKEAVALFEDMVSGEVKPNQATYSALFYACGQGGLHKEATKIHRHMVESLVGPTPDMVCGVVLAYGAAAMYEEALAAFTGMEEAGCVLDVAAYDSLITGHARGGLYAQAGSVVCSMYESGLSASVNTYALMAEAFARAGLFDDAVQVFQDMQDAQRSPTQDTYEALLSVFCMAGLFDEAKAQFLEMREGGFEPRPAAYAVLLALCARRGRWDDARRLLRDMESHRLSDGHRVMRAVILGEGEEEDLLFQWEHAMEAERGQGVCANMALANAAMEALWCCGQRARAARLLQSARQLGLFPEASRRTRVMWSIDVHRLSTGGALSLLLTWLEELRAAVEQNEQLPQLVTIVVRAGHASAAADPEFAEEEVSNIPVRKAVLTALNGLGAPFAVAPWNSGRVISQGPALVAWLWEPELGSRLALANSPLDQSTSGLRPPLTTTTTTTTFPKSSDAPTTYTTTDTDGDQRMAVLLPQDDALSSSLRKRESINKAVMET